MLCTELFHAVLNRILKIVDIF